MSIEQEPIQPSPGNPPLQDLTHLADLIRISNFVSSRISSIIDRPANTGSIGEYIAAAIFEIKLSNSKVHKALDGWFTSGALEGKSVNIKFYSRFGGLLDLSNSNSRLDHAEYYLVMSGPKPTEYLVKGTQAPLVVDRVYLFNSERLLANLSQFWKPGAIAGTATSVKKTLWEEAMIYPEQVNQDLILAPDQLIALKLFGPNP